jgi:hypothetical protein
MEGDMMVNWFLLAGNEPEKFKSLFVSFFSDHNFPQGMALWKWKILYWISSPENFSQDILTKLKKIGIVEFSSAPSSSDLEFMFGDDTSNNSLQTFSSPWYYERLHLSCSSQLFSLP